MPAHSALVKAVEVGIKWYQNLLVGKRLAPERHVPVERTLLTEVFELLSGEKMQIQILAVFGERHPCRVGKQDGGIVTTTTYIIDHQVVKDTGIAILALYVKVITSDLVVKDTLRNLHLRRFLFHREKESPHLHLRLRQHIVLEKERPHGNRQDKDYQRSHHL